MPVVLIKGAGFMAYLRGEKNREGCAQMVAPMPYSNLKHHEYRKSTCWRYLVGNPSIPKLDSMFSSRTERCCEST